ncbi:MAG TPA: MerR family transcriptional regulator [Desulfobulbaceae bacterium]|jgi:DNA-binding transcriptional MerR regulator|nr:MerR family transcriptional regulator [Desulfobulbaceae bacterium]
MDQVSGGEQIPDKVYYRIGEVSGLVGVEPHVLRYWESEFKLIRPRRAKSKQRLYRRQDIETLLLIRDLLHDRGYTISGARKFLDQWHGDECATTTSGEAPKKNMAMDQRLAVIKKELKRIQQLLALKSLRY